MFFTLFVWGLQVLFLFLLLFGILLAAAWMICLVLCIIRLIQRCRGKTASFSILLPVTGALTVGVLLLFCNGKLLRQAFDMVLTIWGSKLKGDE